MRQLTDIDYSGLPESLQDGMRLYIEDRIPTGSFMLAVLSNDLLTACERADDVNRYRLFDIVDWLYNEAPRECWRSPEAVKTWLAQ